METLIEKLDRAINNAKMCNYEIQLLMLSFKDYTMLKDELKSIDSYKDIPITYSGTTKSYLEVYCSRLGVRKIIMK